MEGIKAVQKKYSSRAMLFAIGAALVLIVVGHKPMAKGLVLGTLFSVINFVLMGRMLPARLLKSKRRTFAAALGGIWLRYLILAVPLILSIKLEAFDVAGAVAGIFMIQLVILWDNVVMRMIR